jgi:hypothetical protein
LEDAEMKKSAMLLNLIAALAIASALNSPAAATTGPGCLRVVNIAPGDALNVRRRPNAASRIVTSIIPVRQGILHLDGKCRPLSAAWGSRWCPVSYFTGSPGDPVKGYVKARFVRDRECP